MTRILGILNVTRDSFSDGGRFLDAAAAIDHARRLVAEGADIIDVGAESSHPDGEDVPPELQIARLTPVVERLKSEGIRVSVDAWRPSVIRHALALGADIINDITAARDRQTVAALRDSGAGVILMHSTSTTPRARPARIDAGGILERVTAFFAERIATLTAEGIERHRLILDPGLGLFLAADPRVSLAVLSGLRGLRQFGCPLCVSPSRKSFIGAVLGAGGGAGPDATMRPVRQRGAGTLAAELWAYQQGAEYIRTHDVGALRDAIRMWEAIRAAADSVPACETAVC